MSERLDFQAWMKPEAMWHLAPRAFSSYSWPAAAVSIKAGVQAAVVGPWLIPGTEWGGMRCSTIAVFFYPGRWDPSQCDYLQEAEWQVTSLERAAVAGHRREARRPARLRGGQVPLSAPLGGLSCPGHRCHTQQQQRGCQPAGELARPPSSFSSWIWVDYFLLILGKNVIQYWDFRSLFWCLQASFHVKKNVEDFFSRILRALLINHFGDP